MTHALLCYLALAAAAGRADAPGSLTCEDPTTHDPTRVQLAAVRRDVTRLPRELAKRGVHIVDLGEEAQLRRRRLPLDLASRGWCAVWAHLLVIEDALAMTRVDQGFVAAKFDRVERWTRAGAAPPERRLETERLVATAAAQLADRRYDRANATLNRALAILFGSDDLWRPPASLPAGEESAGSAAGAAPVDADEVAEACPELARQGFASKDELAGVLAQLARTLDERSVRPLDLRSGDALVRDLASYVRLSATWPATRVACGLLARTRSLEIGLGSVMKRLQLANKLRKDRPLSPGEQARHTELVRAATAFMAERQFERAHASADELLVLLGEPRQPSATLPR